MNAQKHAGPPFEMRNLNRTHVKCLWISVFLDSPDIRQYMSRPLRGSNSVVECNLAKVDVEGSNPFSRSL